MVARGEVVAQHIARPYKQVMKAGASLPLALGGVVQHECFEHLKQFQQRIVADGLQGLLDLLVYIR